MKASLKMLGNNSKEISGNFCPYCHREFPTTNDTSNDLAHKKMILRHITNCSMQPLSSCHNIIMKKYNCGIQSSCREINPNPNGDSLFLKNINDQQDAIWTASSPSEGPNFTYVAYTTKTDNVVAAEDIEISCMENDHDEESIAFQNFHDQQYTPSTASSQSEGSNFTYIPNSTKIDVATEDIDEITDKLVAIGSGEDFSTCSFVSRPSTEDIILPTLHCPICFTHFPKEPHIGSKHHEQLVTQHVLECSRQLVDCNYYSTAKQREKKTIPEYRAKNKINNKMKRKPTVTKKKGKKAKYTEFDAPHVISDPKHFVAQTWWRKPANKSNKDQPRVKKSPSAWEFSLEQCIEAEKVECTENETDDVTLQIQRAGDETSQNRKSSRLKNRRKGNALDLCCPICGKNFTRSRYLGDGFFTEEDISRHVHKCSNKVFDTRANLENNKETTQGLCQVEKHNRKFSIVYDGDKIKKLTAMNERIEVLQL